MATMSLHDRIIRYLIQGPRKMAEVISTTRKYRCFVGTSTIGNQYYLYIGKAGAVRYNKQQRLTGAIDIAKPIKLAMVRWEDSQTTILHRGMVM